MPAKIELCILPTPKKVAPREGSLRAPKRIVARVSGENLELDEFIQNALRPLGAGAEALEIRCDPPARGSLRVFIGAPNAVSPPPRALPARFGPEGYRLTVGAASILIEATERPGLFYGLMTLTQILRNHARVPCCVIEDRPDLAVRGIHMDLKGCTPTIDYMKRLVADLSEYKINTLLMEYENAVKLDSTPGVEKPSAWSKADVEELAALARRRCITLMPLVQSLGHVEYILQHDAYARFRESQTNVQQYCPALPETFEFWKAQADEILELFPDTRYFHVGADETRLLGQCDRCRARVEKGEGPLDIYLSHMNKVWRHILDRGRTPIFWDDIVSRNYSVERIKRIPKGVAAMVWIYNITDPTHPFFRTHEGAWGRRGMMRHEWLRRFPKGTGITRWMDEMPAEEWRRNRKFIDDPSLEPLVHSAPYLEMFRERGYEIFGASAAKCGSETMGLPNYVARVDNIRTWARHIARAGGTGVISTAWSRNASLTHPYLPFDTMWYSMCASAEFYWAAEGDSVDRFQANFTRDFFGLNDGGWLAQCLEAASTGGNAAASREFHAATATRHADVLAAKQTAARVQELYAALLGALPRYMMSYYKLDDRFASNWERFGEALAGIYKRVPALKARAADYYRGVMLPEEAEELLASQFRFFEEVDLAAGLRK
ncbi:MAG: family 20 glycosylhydrolase [Candidatus Sumerlaeota bacterium]|nr:family 20 glycosylhydrolase [Candidatus Sumerlaeota bacterium]